MNRAPDIIPWWSKFLTALRRIVQNLVMADKLPDNNGQMKDFVRKHMHVI